MDTGITPISFSLPASDNYYDLSEAYLEIKVKLDTGGVAYQGNNTRNAYCVNNFAHTIFNQITIKMNGVLMSEQNNTYHYKAMIETLTNYNREEGETLLTSQGWVNATNVVNVMGVTGANIDVPMAAGWVGNMQLRALASRLLDKNWHTSIMYLHVEEFHTGKCLVPGVQLNMELRLNPNTVYLIGTSNKGTLNSKVFRSIKSGDIKVTLHMKKVSLNASVYTKLQKERQLSKKPVKYPVVRSEVRTFSFPGTSTKWEQEKVFVGRVPD